MAKNSNSNGKKSHNKLILSFVASAVLVLFLCFNGILPFDEMITWFIVFGLCIYIIYRIFKGVADDSRARKENEQEIAKEQRFIKMFYRHGNRY